MLLSREPNQEATEIYRVGSVLKSPRILDQTFSTITERRVSGEVRAARNRGEKKLSACEWI